MIAIVFRRRRPRLRFFTRAKLNRAAEYTRRVLAAELVGPALTTRSAALGAFAIMIDGLRYNAAEWCSDPTTGQRYVYRGHGDLTDLKNWRALGRDEDERVKVIPPWET